jgi:cell wall-associated NlpC family hydrolase
VSLAPAPEESAAPSATTAESVRPAVVAAYPSAAAKKTAVTSPSPSKGRTAPATVDSSEIVGYDKYPTGVRTILNLALSLTTQNLSYKYGSADPAQGGMDCSGFIYYVLRRTGMSDVPRDAREQYIWVRKAGKFQAVLGRSPDTFELDALKPGDLMFWAGTYNVDRDPAITHTMIYLGRDKATNQRVMVGASDGRTYKGQSRYGVSVFDFKMAGRRAASPGEPGPVFVGYASIPGLGER